MSSNILVGACITLGVLGTWNTWTLYQVNERLEIIEEMNTSKYKVASTKTSAERNSASASQQPNIDDDVRTKRRYKSANNSTPAEQDSGSVQPALDLTDPEIQQTIAKIAETNAKRKEEERRQSKMEAYKTSIKYELENFSDEKGYDSETVQGLGSILDNSSDEWRAVREQVREGDISWIDARTEFKSIGEETEQKVTEFISEEDYKELQGRLWGDWGR